MKSSTRTFVLAAFAARPARFVMFVSCAIVFGGMQSQVMAQAPPQPSGPIVIRNHQFTDEMTTSAQAGKQPLSIQVTALGPKAFGGPIDITWTFMNSTGHPLSGYFVYYIDSNAVSGLGGLNKPIPVGRSTGTFTFANPGPGSHWAGVSLLDRTSTPTTSTHVQTETVEVSDDPKPVSTPTSGVANSPVSVVADGSVQLYTSQTITSLSALSDAQKTQMLQQYAPLMLFSYDHSLQEQYAPIDVVDFIHGSKLESQDSQIPAQSNAQLAQELSLLSPLDQSTINPKQAPTSTEEYAQLPRKVYLSPTQATESGTDWGTVMTPPNHVGMYGHVILQSVANVTDNIALTNSESSNVLQDELASRYNCAGNPANCTAQIIKIEFWQFFGYSHDFQNPAEPITDLAGPATDAILADILDHSGDWCTVQLYVDASWAFSNQPDKAILSVYHYAHGLQFGFDMSRVQVPLPSPTNFQGYSIQKLLGPSNNGQPVKMNVKAGETDAGVQAAQNNIVQLAQDPGSKLYIHPVVYVEWGGHEFFPTSDWDYTLASAHNGAGKYHYIAAGVPNIGEIGQANPPTHQAQLVTSFAGYWGFYGPGSQNGPPQGPSLHKQWMWDPDMPADLLVLRPQIKSLPF
jgi:hypothetical protein